MTAWDHRMRESVWGIWRTFLKRSWRKNHCAANRGEAGPCWGDYGSPSRGWLMLAVGSHLCFWTGEQCAESSEMDYASFCWSGSEWWMDGGSIQNKNIVLEWVPISLKFILKWLLLQSAFELLQGNWSWKKGNSGGWNIQIRHLIYTILSYSHFSRSWLYNALSSCCWLWTLLSEPHGWPLCHRLPCSLSSLCGWLWSPRLAHNPVKAHSGWSVSVNSGSNWVHRRQLIQVSQLSALEEQCGEKLNLITKCGKVCICCTLQHLDWPEWNFQWLISFLSHTWARKLHLQGNGFSLPFFWKGSAPHFLSTRVAVISRDWLLLWQWWLLRKKPQDSGFCKRFWLKVKPEWTMQDPHTSRYMDIWAGDTKAQDSSPKR